jgi:hypothetical protein
MRQILADNFWVKCITSSFALGLRLNSFEEELELKEGTLKENTKVAILTNTSYGGEVWLFGFVQGEYVLFRMTENPIFDIVQPLFEKGKHEANVMDPIIFENDEEIEIFKKRLESENHMFDTLIKEINSFRRYYK